MKKFYYVVRKQLQDVDGFEESNGWKDVSIYQIENNEPKLVEELEIENDSNSEEAVREFLTMYSHVTDNEEITLTHL
jgi:hypothetical protein